MTTPPCPTCGAPLRWFPDHNSWGCDREQKMISPAQLQPQPAYAQAQPGYGLAPQQQMPAPPMARPGKPKSKLVLIVAAAAVAIAGVIIAIVLLTGGGSSGPEGAKTPKELAERGLAAVAAGDASAYLGLTGRTAVQSAMDCKIPDDAVPIDMSELLQLAMKRNKGIKLTIDSVDERVDSDPMTIEAGKSAGNSCVFKKTLTFKDYVIKLKDGSDTSEIRMSAMQLGDRWYLANFGDLPANKEWTAADDEKLEKAGSQIELTRNAHFRKHAGGSPESAVRGFVEAVVWRSRERAQAIALRPEEVETSICDDEAVIDKAKETRELINRFTDDSDDSDEKRPEVVIKSIKVLDRGKADSELRGCKVKTPIEWADVQVEVEVDGKPEKPALGLAVELDGKWRVLHLKTGDRE